MGKFAEVGNAHNLPLTCAWFEIWKQRRCSD